MLDRTDHARLADQAAARLRAAAIADKYIPATDRAVTPTDNQPPAEDEVAAPPNAKTQIEHAKDALAELGAFLKETPVIEDHAQAKLGGGFIERTRVALAEARAERDAKTRPLNEQVGKIRAFYDLVREKTKTNAGGALETAYNELRRRLTNFASAEEEKRIAAANRLRAIAEQAEADARAAEAAEQDAIACADVGECTDVTGAIENADAAFGDFQKANRTAAVAERNVPVRLGSVMGGRSISMRTLPDKLSIASVDDACAAIRAMGVTPELEQTICSMARKYEKAFEEYPAGITVTKQRSI